MYLFRRNFRDSVIEVGPQNSDLKSLTFKSISLNSGEIYEEHYAKVPVDLVFVILSGAVKVELDGIWTFSRESVFDCLPVGFLHRTRSPMHVLALTENTEFAIARTPSLNMSILDKPHMLSSQVISTEIRGIGGYCRTVNSVDSSIHDFGLILGETVADGGNWSSYPPHKHDELIVGVESEHEECYLHHFEPRNGWGFQGILSPERNIEKAYFIRSGDIFAIPYGYHPVVPEPTARHHYLWVLSGSEHRLKMNTHKHYKELIL